MNSYMNLEYSHTDVPYLQKSGSSAGATMSTLSGILQIADSSFHLFCIFGEERHLQILISSGSALTYWPNALKNFSSGILDRFGKSFVVGE